MRLVPLRGRRRMLPGMSRRRPPPRPGPPIGREWRFTSEGLKSNAKLRVAAVAARQQGRIRYEQILRVRGQPRGTISELERRRVPVLGAPARLRRRSSRPHARVRPRRGAALRRTRRDAQPRDDGLVARAAQVPAAADPRQHARGASRTTTASSSTAAATLDRIPHKGLPITTPSQAILDFAATGTHDLLRFVLANADFQGLLDVDRAPGQHRPGRQRDEGAQNGDPHPSPRARTHPQPDRAAAAHPVPALRASGSRTASTSTSSAGSSTPCGTHAKLVVEIDETSGHKTPAQIRQDRQREFDLRANGYIVLRYTEEQLMTMPEAIAAEIASYL